MGEQGASADGDVERGGNDGGYGGGAGRSTGGLSGVAVAEDLGEKGWGELDPGEGGGAAGGRASEGREGKGERESTDRGNVCGAAAWSVASMHAICR